MSDAEPLFKCYTGSIERSQFLVRGVHASVENTAGFINLWCDARWSVPGASFAWIIADTYTDEPFGTFVVIRERHIAEVHFGVSAARSGQGLATEALLVVTSWLESFAEIQRVWTACDLENVAAHAVLERAGYQREGILHKWLVAPALGYRARDCLAFARP